MTDSPSAVATFIAHWSPAGGGKRANYQHFLNELCDLIGAPRPSRSHDGPNGNAYCFELSVRVRSIEWPDSTNFIDLYKRGCFVLEAKQSGKRRVQIAELQLATASPSATSPINCADWL